MKDKGKIFITVKRMCVTNMPSLEQQANTQLEELWSNTYQGYSQRFE